MSRTERPWTIQVRENFSFDADDHPLFAPSDGLSGMTIARRHMLQSYASLRKSAACGSLRDGAIGKVHG
jgi:hypothetical protein